MILVSSCDLPSIHLSRHKIGIGKSNRLTTCLLSFHFSALLSFETFLIPGSRLAKESFLLWFDLRIEESKPPFTYTTIPESPFFLMFMVLDVESGVQATLLLPLVSAGPSSRTTMRCASPRTTSYLKAVYRTVEDRAESVKLDRYHGDATQFTTCCPLAECEEEWVITALTTRFICFIHLCTYFCSTFKFALTQSHQFDTNPKIAPCLEFSVENDPQVKNDLPMYRFMMKRFWTSDILTSITFWAFHYSQIHTFSAGDFLRFLGTAFIVWVLTCCGTILCRWETGEGIEWVRFVLHIYLDCSEGSV